MTRPHQSSKWQGDGLQAFPYSIVGLQAFVKRQVYLSGRDRHPYSTRLTGLHNINGVRHRRKDME